MLYRNSIVSMAKLVSGVLSSLSRHSKDCKRFKIEQLQAESVDREQRRAISTTFGETPKMLWREVNIFSKMLRKALKNYTNSFLQGFNKAFDDDIANFRNIYSDSSISNYFPSWQKVRRQFNRRRQTKSGLTFDPYEPPEILTVTKEGSQKLILDRPMSNDDLWLIFNSKEHGLMLFSTVLQRGAVAHIRVMVADATFECTPVPFRQTYFVHGLIETPNGAEWFVLAMAFMENKSTKAYYAIATVLLHEWNLIPNFDMKKVRIHIDYERGEITGLQAVFGVDIVYGCLVHFIRAVMRHMKSEYPSFYKQYSIESDQKGPLRKWVSFS